MKKLFILFFLGFYSSTAFSQNQSKNMIQFGLDSLVFGAIGMNQTKYDGEEKTSKTNTYYLFTNYAHQLGESPIQIGGTLQLSRYAYDDSENNSYDVFGDLYYNFSSDLRNSAYVLLSAGMSYDHSYPGDDYATHDEFIQGRTGLGYRLPLTILNTANITYSPSVVFTSKTATKKSTSQNYSQDLRFNFVQFSIFF